MHRLDPPIIAEFLRQHGKDVFSRLDAKQTLDSRAPDDELGKCTDPRSYFDNTSSKKRSEALDDPVVIIRCACDCVELSTGILKARGCSCHFRLFARLSPRQWNGD